MGSKKQCSICTKADSQTSTILHSIQKKLAILIKNTQLNEDEDSQSTSDFQGFYRLMRVVFANKFKHSKANLTCRHEHIKKHLMRRLKCSLISLNQLCDQLAGTMGKFNYHVDTLLQQIKNFQRYIKCDKSESTMEESREKSINEELGNKLGESSKSIDKNQPQKQEQGEKPTKKIKTEQWQVARQQFDEKQHPTIDSFPINTNVLQTGFFPQMNYMWYYN